jgi:hypothetical protein
MGDPDRGELERIVHAELQRLPENYRTAAVKCYLEGKTCAQAARILGRPVGTIKGQLSRARALLRYRLGRHRGHDFNPSKRRLEPPMKPALPHRGDNSWQFVHSDESMTSSSRRRSGLARDNADDLKGLEAEPAALQPGAACIT